MSHPQLKNPKPRTSCLGQEQPSRRAQEEAIQAMQIIQPKAELMGTPASR
ncbi:hypothetical protein NC653_028456 [Populus alba x Populus x berolinensis]|uniref:Uncharacterized protein n=1 Tax=Populus alba x Populus x berolinensis TaxID=444605 RepID=A0AAD6Q6F8_9ROSI|nr:hypothetical protein NC653_028456 [Populus alba x Populus x berolinensis]